MEITGTIMDEADIILNTRKRNGQDVKVGTFKFTTTKPTAVIDVALSEEQVAANQHGELRGMVGSRITLQIEYVDNSYAGEGGQHKSFNGFRLFALPNNVKKA
ncbi:hypothetical protein CVS42_09920 [Aeromonas veronii]|uniref:hypothetical protein n=1 Tax=Aeromonas TaxID=642 RepID=UPI000C290AE1|nr:MULTISPECIES: hypothetical protein [Aeromonas]ATY81106.1 hypothetical protein CVS42_09920 [Aeromonas veronii]MCX0422760.1 hypothetical protein [Aeromonas veronii]